jgi:hypothetical protein
MINVYFSHLITNYEEPYNVINFKMVQLHHLLLWVLSNFHKPIKPYCTFNGFFIEEIQGKKH